MEHGDKDWEREEKRLDRVKNLINHKLDKIRIHVKTLKDRVIDIRKNFWDDVTVNLDEMDDVIETQASLKQQAEFLSERERSHGQLSKEVDTLERLNHSPYFGRIDFKEDGEATTQPIYIGIASLMDERDEDFLIYDWRAPISSMYYDYPPGLAKYEAVDQEISGEITLKRQYIIRQGQFKGMFDTGLTIGDHLLQSMLGGNASTTMKSIVATIQREQNQIIRNERSKFLVVQGVAGSGKTSAALQRVAYLLYRYREELSSDNMILFSPNPLFNSYVSTVLPELGEDNMKQTTFYRYVDTYLGYQFAVESPFEQMEYYLSANKEQPPARITAMRYKASIAFKNLIDQFLQDLQVGGIQFRNIRFRSKLVVSKKQMWNFFYALPSSLSIPVRMEKMKHWLMEQLDELEKTEVNEDWVLEESELLDKADYLEVHQQLQEETPFSEDTFMDYAREEALLRKKVIKNTLKPLRKKIQRLYFIDVKQTYLQLFNYQWYKAEAIDQQLWQQICSETREKIQANALTWEDAVPYLYFEKSMKGFRVNRTMKHVIIDEAQDYTPFQFAYLRKVFPASRMTLLGDINQAIYVHALEEENVLADQNHKNFEKITLTRSYRSTKPIVEFTRSWMPEGDQIEAFNRDGSLPEVMEVDDLGAAEDRLLHTIEHYKAKGHETIAIICKTLRESEEVYHYLKQYMDVTLLDPTTHTFHKGVLVIPTYLAKGIEFDAVLLYNASKTRYQTELERNLLYTACTRAMHDLFVLSLGELSPYIQQVPKQYFKHYKIHATQ
ncbi:DNA helicase IV [Paraliobacillus ryukyuensis]|uniref:DNA helicase-2/ATP-dependent DNA helicase PcrA n=1 Tax=Paraliobacillus ryukyuensis TaxID=200904 RepID=A0A366EDN7_9BACI|nr:RNA polymerase recycling motor HelD [Paraliobacillus ryukyuensis]RBP00428.1 DNA helicase-2/ATP-dependent DNA helicase PcrA [Paraliobacillus ryukyuensis]